MSIYKDLNLASVMARRYSNQFRINYTVVLLNPVDGLFDEILSTYEIVDDSYFIDNPEAIRCYESKTMPIGVNYESFATTEIIKHEVVRELTDMKKYSDIFEVVRTPPFIRGEKIGRNDFCSCGSGKKSKKCCE